MSKIEEIAQKALGSQFENLPGFFGVGSKDKRGNFLRVQDLFQPFSYSEYGMLLSAGFRRGLLMVFTSESRDIRKYYLS